MPLAFRTAVLSSTFCWLGSRTQSSRRRTVRGRITLLYLMGLVRAAEQVRDRPDECDLLAEVRHEPCREIWSRTS
jgi:hypothetical protein